MLSSLSSTIRTVFCITSPRVSRAAHVSSMTLFSSPLRADSQILPMASNHGTCETALHLNILNQRLLLIRFPFRKTEITRRHLRETCDEGGTGRRPCASASGLSEPGRGGAGPLSRRERNGHGRAASAGGRSR